MEFLGKKIDNLSLKDHNGKIEKLYHLQKKVLLSFHPLAWTSICSKQMLSIEEKYDVFAKLNVAPFGVSVDPLPSKKAWAESLNIKKLPLITDFWPHGEIAKSFGLFREKDGFSERANVILDENKVVIFYKIYPIEELPDIEELIGFLKK
ncbi:MULTISPECIES: redoxin domain-containing protein [Pseudothermotoga]|jgi:peroxiredoxin|uniref:Alkyl hydroperoxide reductase/ Thiol specific antioxidant/ Mal allergen n=1 Tax=Pseudothermotoga lettingae (strain ATCC BAA-301 / DSM 14385 / NBRC 107922 / TMO) TaxID=416591 RepID=A8F4Q0_PSELT|nr:MULTISPECIES: redoxin domain-containing protein [Pseudothermotoga]ABV33134.1 alkyl hydroperoxide reductase/ Thiol specific antioxidant/ Mal allergen [Pseudothermotoga lettingae TMO]KUK21063.1 MAG: Alkyl hydroperoxide reductase/ Thiol specific antioxidant/ Mal allergen [Pseudothermotoga lettingae]MDI3494401.1 hypothetical protein [Pseudothermotoga sp.]MDK2884140.1 hypothetical protein [Pseudothermotoga sp.]GLI47864.1 peroxiredoxin [Pseudothermotoga lettingae TMO]